MFHFFDVAFIAEVLLVVLILAYVPYTEIDWRAYMEQISLVMNGETDYQSIAGGTGPLVYPAGFVWLFSGLYAVTKGGVDVSLAQWIFAAVYLCTLSFTLKLHRVAGVSFWATLPLFLSKRIRSLYLLRLFNDCWAVFFALLAVLRACTIVAPSVRVLRYRYWYWGCLLMSVAISVKMNNLLFCPGLLCVLWYTVPLTQLLVCGGVGMAWQLLVATPFLLDAPGSYLSRAFELGRSFDQRWSVNYQFLPPKYFNAREFHGGLLAALLVTYALVWWRRWRPRSQLLKEQLAALREKKRLEKVPINSGCINPDQQETTCLPHVLTLLESNLIGFAFCRSMHYQFYSWIFFSMLFVLHHTRLPTVCSLAAFWAVQYGFEVYPPTAKSSASLMCGLVAMVLSVTFLGRDCRQLPITDAEPPPDTPALATNESRSE